MCVCNDRRPFSKCVSKCLLPFINFPKFWIRTPVCNWSSQPRSPLRPATQLFRLFSKYRPETKQEKKERLNTLAEATVDGAKVDAGKKPLTVKYGINHITALVESKKTQLVAIADDVDPIEVRFNSFSLECVLSQFTVHPSWSTSVL